MTTIWPLAVLLLCAGCSTKGSLSDDASSADDGSVAPETDASQVADATQLADASDALDASRPDMASAEKAVFDCTAFAASGACGTITSYPGGQNFYLVGNGGPALVGSSVLLMDPAHSDHVADSLMYQKPVSVQSFTARFTFVPNDWNLAFVLENTNNVTGFDENVFVAGAGCEAGFYQAFTGAPPNNIFALEFDERSSLQNANTNYNAPFTYSSVQIYQQDQSPCNPNDSQPNYVYKQKISTAPVSLNKPNQAYTPTGDTYSATIQYSGTTLTLDLYDVTLHGSCPGSSCFSYTWTGVDIPSWVDGETAYVGLTTGTSQPSSDVTADVGPTSYPLYIDSFSYETPQP